MLKPFTSALLLASLLFAGTAHAADVGLFVRGNNDDVQASGFGHAAADVLILGDDDRVDVFVGPCARAGRSRTVLRDSGQHRVLVARCP